MEREIEKDRIAAEQLGLDDSWTIVYTTNQIGFIHDKSDVSSELDEDYMTLREVEAAVEKSTHYFDTPKGWRLVGMRRIDDPVSEHTERKYGMVDFSAIGCT